MASPFAFQTNFVPTNSLCSFAVQIIESMRTLHKLLVTFSLCFVFLFLGCVSRPVITASYVPESFDWQEISDEAGAVVPGVWRFDFENPEIPLIYHAVKINLKSVSEGDKAGLKLATSQWERTADFAARENCLVAMNVTPFDKTKLAGIYKVNGELVSGPVARYAALGVKCDAGGQASFARVFTSQKDSGLEAFDYVFGGFFTVVEEDVVRTDFILRQTSRSGAGVSEDGRTLYLLVVEGEHPSKSLGLSYPQCGEIFKAMGCYDALEFDGGGSSDLCISGRSVLSYKVRRVQGNSVGLKKRP